MIINNILENNTDITIENYLKVYNLENVKDFIFPNGKGCDKFSNYDNADVGYNLFMKHIDNNSRICLYVDIDNDGMTGSAIMLQYIYELNSNAKVFIIMNNGKQHGITQDVIDCVINNNCRFLIVPDAGASDYAEHKYLKEQGIDMLILEHHESKCYSDNAIIISNQLSKNIKNKYACGASITYKFVAYCEQKQGRKLGWKYIDLCAFGIIGDMMSLAEIENRTYIHFGLNHITNPMLKQMCKKFIKSDKITPKDIAFSIVPKINALIRQDNMDNKLQLFYCLANQSENYDEVIKLCKKAHREQQNIVKEMYEEISPTITNENKVIIAFCNKTNYTGLCANKICNDTGKPTLLVHKDRDILSGSARSPIPFKDVLDDWGKMIINQGHSMANGVAWKECDTEDLVQYLEQLEIPSDVVIDVTQSFQSNNIPDYLFGYFDEYSELFGQGLPFPKFYIDNIKLKGTDIQEIGNGSTIRFNVNGITFIKFFVSKKEKEKYHIGENVKLSIECVCELKTNEWNWNVSNQCVIDKMEVNVVENDYLDWETLF